MREIFGGKRFLFLFPKGKKSKGKFSLSTENLGGKRFLSEKEKVEIFREFPFEGKSRCFSRISEGNENNIYYIYIIFPSFPYRSRGKGRRLKDKPPSFLPLSLTKEIFRNYTESLCFKAVK